SSSQTKPEQINKIVSEQEDRILTDMAELNRVLGGGIVKGSLVLIGGDPGIGKSTLLLKTSAQVAKKTKVLYVSGEESVQQTKLRADRLKVDHDNLYVVAETMIELITHQIEHLQTGLLIIDSIHTMMTDAITRTTGTA